METMSNYYNKHDSLLQNQRRTHKIFQRNSPQAVQCRDFQELLLRLSYTDDIDVLVKIISTLGICLLTKNIAYDQAIKCDTLYKKLDLVLKSNLQTKAIVALNFISVMLNVNQNGSMTKMALNVYAKIMIRTSGCLTTMSDIFTGFMMQQDLWKALCRSISETCDGNFPNQSHCAHLVPLCLQRCRRGDMEPIRLLISLLSNHPENIKLFHEINGMTIFNGEFLQHPACLQLLNLVVENTTPEYHKEILKASDLFRELRFYLKKTGLNSSIRQWISIILFSHTKVLGNETNFEDEDKHFFEHQNNKTGPSFMIESKYTENDTNELISNVLKEAVGWQNQFGSNKFRNIFKENNNYKVDNVEEQPSFAKIYKPKINNLNPESQNNYNIPRFSFESSNKNDLSFSFLMKASNESSFSRSNYRFRLDQHQDDDIQISDHNTLSVLHNTSKILKYDEYFKPPFASTPKGKKPISRIRQKSNSTYRISRDRSKCSKITNNRNTISSTAINKKLRDKSFSAKFMDIVNGSCTTLIKGFRNVFGAKKPRDTIDESTEFSMDVIENNSYTRCSKNYSQQRNACDFKEKEAPNWTNFTKQISIEMSDLHSCNTCNDTLVLNHKFHNDVLLRKTVKKLKLAINLYGCDFKKISRTVWPREACMTPNVLYNLYRKLIIKQ